MKRLLLCALAFNALAANAPAQTPAEAPQPKPATVKAEPGQFFPEDMFAAELKDFYDVDFTLGEYRGRVFVLNFWASWCGPCRQEMPELNKLHEEFAPRGVEFVGLTTESPGAGSEKVREFARLQGVAYRLGWADPDVFTALTTRPAIPQTLVVGADGRIVTRFVGFSKRIPPLLRAGIEKALAPPAEEEKKAEPEPATQTPSAPPAAPETSRPPRS